MHSFWYSTGGVLLRRARGEILLAVPHRIISCDRQADVAVASRRRRRARGISDQVLRAQFAVYPLKHGIELIERVEREEPATCFAGAGISRRRDPAAGSQARAGLERVGRVGVELARRVAVLRAAEEEEPVGSAGDREAAGLNGLPLESERRRGRRSGRGPRASADARARTGWSGGPRPATGACARRTPAPAPDG